MMVSAHLKKKEFFDGLASRWMENNPLEEEEMQLVDSCLSRLELKPGDVLLDLAGGIGRLSGYLCRLFPVSCLVVDISTAMLREGRSGLGTSEIFWLEADAHRLPFRSGSVHHVICYCAFPHFDRQEIVVQEVKRVLRPKGNFLVIHNRSRRDINRFHSRRDRVIASDRLPSLSRFRKWGGRFNLETMELSDQPGRFIVQYQKPA